MCDSSHYVIRGGIQGHERLRILARVMRPTTSALLDRLDLRDGQRCVDIGCGSGDVTFELARRVAPSGTALGTDIDETKIALAREEVRARGVTNVEFRLADTREQIDTTQFDVVYARFLLTHLPDPAAAAAAFYARVKPGGLLVVEDIDCKGHFTYPESSAFQRYNELYCAVVRRRGGDPFIGPRLPVLLTQAGFSDVSMSIVQPAGMQGEAKLMNPITMENIADAVVTEGLATREETEQLARDLYAFAADPMTVAGVPRVVQVWGTRAAGGVNR
jgi:SAM-dependent methyltransferase